MNIKVTLFKIRWGKITIFARPLFMINTNFRSKFLFRVLFHHLRTCTYQKDEDFARAFLIMTFIIFFSNAVKDQEKIKNLSKSTPSYLPKTKTNPSTHFQKPQPQPLIKNQKHSLTLTPPQPLPTPFY